MTKILTVVFMINVLALIPALSQEIPDCPPETLSDTPPKTPLMPQTPSFTEYLNYRRWRYRGFSDPLVEYVHYVKPKVAHLLIVENPELWQKMLKSSLQHGVKNGPEGVLRFSIDKNGKLQELEHQESSGDLRLDEKVIAYFNSCQFCKPPFGAKGIPYEGLYQVALNKLVDELKKYREYRDDYFVLISSNRSKPAPTQEKPPEETADIPEEPADIPGEPCDGASDIYLKKK